MPTPVEATEAPISPLRNQFIYFVSGAALYGLGFALITFHPYFRGIVSNRLNLDVVPEYGQGFMRIALALAGPTPYHLISRLFIGFLIVTLLRSFWLANPVDLRTHRPTQFFATVWDYLRFRWPYLKGDAQDVRNPYPFTPWRRTNLLYFLVKLFYGPLMLNFLYSNVHSMCNSYNGFVVYGNNPDQRIAYGYFLIFYSMIMVDVGFFCFGYFFELKKYSYVRSVEPTFSGWAIALMCYPPFLDVSTRYIGWGSQEYSTFGSRETTMAVLAFVLFNYFVYVWATVALGPKGSNLTNRGIVDWGPYRFVRHPAYICKNTAWIVMGIPMVIANPWTALTLLLWAFVYFLRALTEERHLMADPDYVAYCQKVRKRFVPGVY